MLFLETSEKSGDLWMSVVASVESGECSMVLEESEEPGDCWVGLETFEEAEDLPHSAGGTWAIWEKLDGVSKQQLTTWAALGDITTVTRDFRLRDDDSGGI